MHVSRLGPDCSITIPQLSPVMQAALPVCGIFSLLDNLKIDMIYGMKEMNGYKTVKRLSILLRQFDCYREDLLAASGKDDR